MPTDEVPRSTRYLIGSYRCGVKSTSNPKEEEEYSPPRGGMAAQSAAYKAPESELGPQNLNEPRGARPLPHLGIPAWVFYALVVSALRSS